MRHASFELLGPDLPAPEQTDDPRVRVLQVRRGVAVEREHRVPIENVVARPVFRQICVLHCADADGARDVAAFALGQSGVLAGDQFVCALLRFVQQFDQLHEPAVARTERPAVFAQHHAERMVLERRVRGDEAGAPGHREYLTEMQALPRVDEIQHAIRVQRFRSIADGREIGRRIQIAAVGLLHDDRLWRSVLRVEFIEKNALRAVGDRQQSCVVERANDIGQIVVVRAFGVHVRARQRNARAVRIPPRSDSSKCR